MLHISSSPAQPGGLNTPTLQMRRLRLTLTPYAASDNPLASPALSCSPSPCFLSQVSPVDFCQTSSLKLPSPLRHLCPDSHGRTIWSDSGPTASTFVLPTTHSPHRAQNSQRDVSTGNKTQSLRPRLRTCETWPQALSPPTKLSPRHLLCSSHILLLLIL